MRLPFVCLLLLAGCETPQSQQARADQYDASVSRQCQGYGFTPGTDAFANCRMQVFERNRAAAMGVLMNQRPVQVPQQQPYMIPRPTTTNCFTNSSGYTNCQTR